MFDDSRVTKIYGDTVKRPNCTEFWRATSARTVKLPGRCLKGRNLCFFSNSEGCQSWKGKCLEIQKLFRVLFLSRHSQVSGSEHLPPNLQRFCTWNKFGTEVLHKFSPFCQVVVSLGIEPMLLLWSFSSTQFKHGQTLGLKPSRCYQKQTPELRTCVKWPRIRKVQKQGRQTPGRKTSVLIPDPHGSPVTHHTSMFSISPFPPRSG